MGVPTVETKSLQMLETSAHGRYGPSRRNENGDFYLIMANFQWERLVMALGAVGSMEVVMARALEAAAGRLELRHTVAELAVRLEASRCLTNHALYLFAGGHDAIRE
jgi:acyl-CoA dehydrogenase